MKKRYTILTCFMVFLLMIQFGFASDKIDVNAKSAVLMEQSSKRVLYQKNAQVKRPMASTTKIMTALVALENKSLTDVITIPKEASGVEGSSIWLSVGEKHTLEDLLYGLMLSSGNDAAVAIAIHVGGSVEGFAQMMNDKAKEIGANDTNFVTPHGLHDDNHYTTAYDLALISAVAMDNNDFATIVNTRNKTIPWEDSPWDRSLRNKNKIIWQYEGGNGIKTGYTSNAGKCLVSAANKENMQLVGVVLNCYDMFEESKKMLSYGFENYDLVNAFEKNKIIGKTKVNGGTVEEIEFISQNDIMLPVTNNEKDKIVIDINIPDSINAPVKKDQKIGEASIYLNNELIGVSKLMTTTSVVKNSFGYNINRVLRLWNNRY